MLAEYENSQFSHFFALDQKIQEGIMRARSWRAKWFQNPKELVDEAKNIQIKKAKETNYSTTVAELKERQYQRFLELLSLLLHELKGDFAGKEAKVVALCDKQLAHIENEYLGFSDRNEPLSEQERESAVISRLIKALANSLDAHTSYYSPDEAYAMKVQLEKGMCGIGVVLREGIEGIIIQDIIAGGPAAKSGKIQKGDTIVEVDGEPVKQHSFHRVLEIMKGKEGSKTILGVIRQNASKPDVVRVELIRSKITLPDQRVDVQAEPFGDGIIGKITLHSFYEGEDGISSEKDVKKAIDHLQENGPLYGLILDMRNNAGGFLSQSVKVTGLFISSGVVVISKYADGTMKYYRAVDGVRYYDGPLVVLVSRGSASATEIVAQSLQDYGVAVVVGDEQTYGKGTIQHQTITSDGPPAFFKVTIGRYYTVSGKSTQIEGVKSDIVVPTAYNFEELGEAYLEYPLPIDSVAEAYNDSLSDIDVLARKWFKKYYIPTLQQKETYWTKLLPSLRSNSHKRVQQNKNYQLFLKEIKEELKPIEVLTFGVNDLQMEEAVNIVKDMILFKQSQEATF
jgi:carboxyl-terminal processing protease